MGSQTKSKRVPTKISRTYKLRKRSTKTRKLYTFDYPETIVLSISTHGKIHVTEEGKYETFRPNKHLLIYKINVVPPGVCNLVYDEQMPEHVKTIKTALQKIREPGNDMTDDDMYTFSNHLRNELYNYQNGFIKDLHKHLTTLKSKTDVEEEEDIEEHKKTVKMYEDYLHHYDKGFLLCNYSDMKLLNKRYSRENEQGINERYDWQIIAINATGQPDIVKNMMIDSGQGAKHYDESEVSLKEIIQHLQKHSVKNILFVDFSCANFVDESNADILTARGERSVRKEILEHEKPRCTPLEI